ncbi:NAD(P)H-dependent oxidoreductase subunit E [Oscillospiraceae bacterium OttesenSCG-928-G22]|nr:NAD(P)H-dependent oxidoreductase subunit E [Oscillospiraceae bacterium OttesenSCG-928-G22]
MPNLKTLVPFKGTKEQEKELQSIIEMYKGERGATLQVLQKAQDVYGYLPEEVQILIAEGLEVPLSEVYGIASFYTQFSLNPKGEYQVAVCLGTACYVKGAGTILDRIVERLDCKPGSITADGRFSVDATRCIGACGLAPVLTINEEVHGRLVPEDVDGILDNYVGVPKK